MGRLLPLIRMDVTEYTVLVWCEECEPWRHLTDSELTANQKAREHIWQVHPSETVVSHSLAARISRSRKARTTQNQD